MDSKSLEDKQRIFRKSLTTFRHHANFDRIPGASFRTAKRILKGLGIFDKNGNNLHPEEYDPTVDIAECIRGDQIAREIPPEFSLEELRSKVAERLNDARPSQPGLPESMIEQMEEESQEAWTA